MLEYIIPAALVGGYGFYKYCACKITASKLKEREQTQLEKMSRSPWWNLQKDKELIIDTNVWMTPSTSIDLWFDMLCSWLPVMNCRISMLWQTYEEIESKRNIFEGRLAKKRVDIIQDAIPENFSILRPKICAERDARRRYADPPTIRYMMKHPDAILFTFDRDLKIRAKNIGQLSNIDLDIRQEKDFICFGCLLHNNTGFNDHDPYYENLYSDYLDNGAGCEVPYTMNIYTGGHIDFDSFSCKFINTGKAKYIRRLQLIHRMEEKLTGITYAKSLKALPYSPELPYPDESNKIDMMAAYKRMLDENP